MRLLFGHDAQVAGWAAKRIAHMHGEGFGPCSALGIVSAEGGAIGAAVFNNYQPAYRSIEISFVLDHPGALSRTIISQILTYPFAQLDCQRVTAVTPRKARPARRFLEKFGFAREGNVRRGFGTDDAIIYGLLKKDWERSRFRTPLNGKVRPHASNAPEPDADHQPVGGG